MKYLPEWKVYLWIKLLFNKDIEDGFHKLDDFLFFDQEEQQDFHLQQVQNSIDSIDKAYHKAISTRSEMDVNLGSDTPHKDSFYHFEHKPTLSALIELAQGKILFAKVKDVWQGVG